MAYLLKDDYTLRISLEYLDQVLETAASTSGLSEANVLSNAESWAQATIKSYLSTQYDIDAEFALTGASRSYLIMQVMIDLVSCTVHKTINPRDVPENVANACVEAMKWLTDARDRVIDIGIPTAPPDDDGNSAHYRTFLDSQTKFISKPFQDRSIYPDEPIAP